MNIKRMGKESIRRKLYAIFFIIIGINTLTMLYQYNQMQRYGVEVAKRKSVEEFFLIKNMIQNTFEYFEQKYNAINDELKNRVNTLYNLMLNDAFKPLKNNLEAAKLLISSNLNEGFYEVSKLSMDGKLIDSSNQNKLTDNAPNIWIHENLNLALQNPGKIYISPLLLNFKTQHIQLHALVLAPNQKEFLQISYSDHFPSIILDKIKQIKNSFSNLKEIQIHLISHQKRSLINVQRQETISYEHTYSKFMGSILNLYKRVHHNNQIDNDQISTVELITFLKEKNYILDTQNNLNTFYMINNTSFNMLGNYELLIKASLLQNSNKEIDFIQNMVLYSFVIVLLAVLYFYYIIRESVILPLEKITEATFRNKPITDKKILSNHNEISLLAKSINYFDHRLSRQIRLKNRLLENQKIFIGNAIHELSTPLNVIALNTDLLEMQYGKSDPIKYIISAIKQIVSIKEDITFTMLNRNIEYTIREIELCTHLKKCIEFFSQIIWVNDKNIILNCNKEIFLKISDTELSLLINNNISNAIKYGTNSKEILIDIDILEHSIKLSFTSSGQAIINPKKIFQRFYRESNERKGFGIGLNIVFNICKKYQIEYDIKSNNGYNIFNYYIPLGGEYENSVT